MSGVLERLHVALIAVIDLIVGVLECLRVTLIAVIGLVYTETEVLIAVCQQSEQ